MALAAAAFAVAIPLQTCLAAGTVYQIHATGPTTSCDEQFETLANSLQPGDELVLHDGEYWQACRRAITVHGTAEAPIVIRAADGANPVLTRAADDFNDNNIEIDGSYLTIRGIAFRGGSAGVRFMGGSHITFEDNEVYDTANNAINMNSGSTDSFVIRNNHIHHTGIVGDDTEGEGMYVGCHSGSCVASNHLIEGNYIHHLRSTSGGGNDGIELKYRSYGNIVRGNLIHDTNIGTEYPCIFSYGGGTGEPNVIENNVVYNCGEAILVTADTIVRNNVILNSSSHGIHSRTQSPSSTVRNVSIVNNTVYGSHPVCAQLRWSSASNVTFANNALYCSGSTAVQFSGLSNADVSSNFVVGSLSGASIDNTRFLDGGSAQANFAGPASGDFHLLAGSALIDAGDDSVAHLPAADHDGGARIVGAGIDVGAYEFGTSPSSLSVTLDASPQAIVAGTSVTLTWSSAGATGCTASGGWSGPRATSGSETAGPLETTTFVLTCTDGTNTESDDATVTVTAPPNDDHALVFGADHSTFEALNGATLAGQQWIFVMPENGVTSVSFALNGQQVQVENSAPFDLAGSLTPFDTATLPDGRHVIDATVSRASGPDLAISATFEVANDVVVDGPADLPTTGDTADGAGGAVGVAWLTLLGLLRLLANRVRQRHRAGRVRIPAQVVANPPPRVPEVGQVR